MSTLKVVTLNLWGQQPPLEPRMQLAVDRLRALLAELIGATPSELPKILCGDFNATPDSDEIRFLRGLHTAAGRRTFWQDAWERRHGRADGFTWARANPYTARLRWLERDRRLDYIFV